MRVVSAAGDVLVERTYEAVNVNDVAAALATAGAWLRDELKIYPVAIGHRVVHGEPDYGQTGTRGSRCADATGAVHFAGAASPAL